MKKIIFNSILGLSLLTACTSSGDIIGRDEINLNGPKQIIQTVTTVGNPNVFNYTVAGNKFIKLSNTNNTISHEITYNNNKISHINGFVKDVNLATTNLNIDFIYSGTTLTGLQGTEENAGTTSTISTTYTYTNGKASKILTTRTTPQPVGNPVVTYAQNDLLYNGYNLYQSVFTVGTITNNVATPTSVVTTTYSGYDTKINYLSGLPLEYGLFSGYNATGLNYLSANNAQTVNIDTMGQVSTTNVTYQYGNAAMPTIANSGNSVTNYTYQPWNN